VASIDDTDERCIAAIREAPKLKIVLFKFYRRHARRISFIEDRIQGNNNAQCLDASTTL
jgi:hypothetical protein